MRACGLPRRARGARAVVVVMGLLAVACGCAAEAGAEGGAGREEEDVAELTAFLETAARGFPEEFPTPTSRQKKFVEKAYPWDTVRLHPEQCAEGPAYGVNAPAGMEHVTEVEKCHLCRRIYKNSLEWNWRWHYSALCAKVPPHLMDLCKHYACRMASNCPEFITSRCLEGGGERFPCPAKYVCWNCLRLPSKQFAGCFDGH